MQSTPNTNMFLGLVRSHAVAGKFFLWGSKWTLSESETKFAQWQMYNIQHSHSGHYLMYGPQTKDRSIAFVHNAGSLK